MIRIKSLVLKDFMNIQDASFEFGNINYFYGNPASGKSAVFEAISICLSNEKRASSYGEYVRQGCDKAVIDLKFEIFSDEAEIKLNINRVYGTPYECELTYKGEVYKNTKASEKLKSLGLLYYSNIMFQMQNAQDIVDQTPSSRLEYIKNLFNFNYEPQKLILTEKIQQTKEKINSLFTEKTSKNALKKELSKLETLLELPLNNEELLEINNMLTENMNKIQKINEQHEKSMKLSTKMNTKAVEISTYKKDLSNYKAELERVESFSEKINSLVEKIIELKESNEKTQKEYDAKKEKIDAIKVDYENNKKLYDSKNGEKNILVGKLSSLRERENACKDGVCPICGQKTNDAVAHFQEDISRIEDSVSSLEKECDDLKKKIRTNELDISELEKEALLLQNNMQTNFLAISSNESTKRVYEDGIDAKNNIISDLEKSKEKLANAEKEYALLEEDYKKIKVDDLSSIIKQNEDLQNRIKNYELVINENKHIKASNDERIEKVEKITNELSDIENSLIELNRMSLVYNEAWDVLNKMLPQYRTKLFCDSINRDLNNFIHLIFPKYDVCVETKKSGCYFFYTKDNTVKDEKKNKTLDIKMSSGFERAVLNTAFKTILAKYYNIDFFVGDEIDKASSDEDSIKLFSVLLGLHQFSQIFLISHKKALGNYLQDNYDDIFIFKAENGKFVKKN